MVQLSPDTRIDGSWDGCSGYHYDDSLLYGFSHTHLSGTGVSDYGDILLLPLNEKFNADKKYAYSFSHSKETASPGYYSVYLPGPRIEAEFTATERTGFHAYTYKNTGDSAGIMIDLRHRDHLIDAQLYQVDETHLAGYRRSSAWAKDQLVYFYIEFSEKIVSEIVKCDSVFPGDKNKPGIYAGNIYGSFRFRFSGEKKNTGESCTFFSERRRGDEKSSARK